jgi:hypothetical protein
MDDNPSNIRSNFLHNYDKFVIFLCRFSFITQYWIFKRKRSQTSLFICFIHYLTTHKLTLIRDKSHWFTKKYYFSVASTKVGELNSIFYAEFNFFLVFLYHARFLSDIQL